MNISAFLPSKHRTIEIDKNCILQSIFVSNYIKTNKYNPYLFLIVSLFNQFKRYANIYFLVAAILQSIPQISPLDKFSSISPLVFILLLSMAREAYEDYQRYKNDKLVNNKVCKRLRKGMSETNEEVWEVIKWKDVRVGDLLMLSSDEYLPADLVCLKSSNEGGICFIMTSSLDGEKNLKQKFVPKEIEDKVKREGFNWKGSIHCNSPNADLNDFNGEIKMEMEEVVGLGSKQLLLRESQLKNTEELIGIVVYTGNDTKVMQNADEPIYKISKVEKQMNRLILVLIVFQILLCLTIAICSFIWNSQHADDFQYFIPKRYSPFTESVLNFFTCFILMLNLIPISLIVSLEFVKLFQKYFINVDEDMAEDGRFSKNFSAGLSEEIGQIEYVFTDKTGTLTKNNMEFRLCVIGNELYGDTSIVFENNLENKIEAMDHFSNENEQFLDPNLMQYIRKDKRGNSFSRHINKSFFVKNEQELIENFMLTLSVNHECLCDNNKQLQGPSPDEVTLVNLARQYGYEFIRNTNKGKIVKINGVEQEIEILKVFEFTSKRKRSSIIIRHNGLIKLLIKGADSAIKERLQERSDSQPFKEEIDYYADEFSFKGFRTLYFGLRVFSEEEYENIKKYLDSLNVDSQKQEKIEQKAEELENDLLLIGCTAVEDQLQDEVPEVINYLIEARIKVWMITGDKLETAENIGFSCKLIQKEFHKLYFRRENKTSNQTDKHSLKNGLFRLKEEIRRCREQDTNRQISLIVEGPMIIRLSEFDDLAKEFTEEVFTQCDSVVCCRMSPKQKGEIVKFIKKYQKKITLAIGDGANDVNMIQEAHVGVGLYGKEGLRAVQASDYALVNFRSLWKLLFFHGRLSYYRNTEFIKYFFYKNFIIAIPQLLFMFYNAFSAQTIFDDWYITFYNMLFTAVPVTFRAVIDMDITYKFAKRGKVIENNLKKFYHHLYFLGRENRNFKYFKKC